MSELTQAQTRTLCKLGYRFPLSAYTLQERLSTLRALEKKGYVKDVTPPGPGGMFSPNTHFRFVRIK